MKQLILFILIINLSFSAEIDTKLYDTLQNKSYLNEIKEIIISSEKSNTKTPEIINTEKAHLKRLSDASISRIIIDEFDIKVLAVEKNLPTSILKATFYISENIVKENKQKELLNDIQNKLSLLKKRIENIVEEDKNSLLSYQLQYAYYKIQKTNIETRIELFNTNKNKILEETINALEKKVSIKADSIEKEIIELKKEKKQLIQQRTAYQIELEKEVINENNKNIEYLKKEILKVEDNYQIILIKEINFVNRKIVYTLVEKDDKQYSILQKEMISILEEIDLKMIEIHKEQNYVFNQIAKKIFGNTKVFLNTSLSETKNYAENLKKYFTSTIIVFNEQAISFLSILKALFIIISGFVIGSFYKRWLFKVSTKWPNISQMSLRLTANVGFYLIILITIMISMSSLGIDMSSISLIAGALSIGIGFGLQTVVSNFIAGIILMFERTIRIGDIIEINPLVVGTVTDIRIRSTSIKTFDNIDIIIPNSSFIQNNVINWTLDDATRRLHIPFGVAYGTKVEKIKEVIFEELKKSDLIFLKNVKDKDPDIRLVNMNTSSVDFELLVWVKANDKFKPSALKSDFLILIYNALYKYNIEIPFPQLDLHLKKSKGKENNE